MYCYNFDNQEINLNFNKFFFFQILFILVSYNTGCANMEKSKNNEQSYDGDGLLHLFTNNGTGTYRSHRNYIINKSSAVWNLCVDI